MFRTKDFKPELSFKTNDGLFEAPVGCEVIFPD